MAAKRTHVTEREKEKMWQLYQEGYTFKRIAEKMRRDRGTVSRYVYEYEAAVRATNYTINAKAL